MHNYEISEQSKKQVIFFKRLIPISVIFSLLGYGCVSFSIERSKVAKVCIDNGGQVVFTRQANLCFKDGIFMGAH